MQIVGGGGMETEKREEEYVGEGSTAISGRDSSDALLHTYRHLHTHIHRVLWHSEDRGGWGGDNVAQE